MLIIIGTTLLIGFFLMLMFIKRGKSDRVSSDKKCILITGCDSGVGLALALQAHALGFRVIATCLNPLSGGAKCLMEKTPEIIISKVDVTEKVDINRLKSTVDKFIHENSLSLWAVINNAGVLVYGHFDWQIESQIMQQINVNLVGAFNVTKEFLPLLRQSKGRIINITSANGQWCLPGLSVYCATKHAIEGFSHSLRMELKPWDVKVILINPGNLPQSTKILFHQAQHALAMKEAFNPSDWAIYGEYFNCFQHHLQKNFSSAPQDLFEDKGLSSILEASLLDGNPKPKYSNLPLGLKLFVNFCRYIPSQYADSLLLKVWGDAIGWNWDKMKPNKKEE